MYFSATDGILPEYFIIPYMLLLSAETQAITAVTNLESFLSYSIYNAVTAAKRYKNFNIIL